MSYSASPRPTFDGPAHISFPRGDASPLGRRRIGIAGYFCGTADIVIQRIVEFIRAMPGIPLWLALSAAIPKEWPVTRVYIAITLILSSIGWTGLARVVRGRLLALREEDFVQAARLAGASDEMEVGGPWEHAIHPIFAGE